MIKKYNVRATAYENSVDGKKYNISFVPCSRSPPKTERKPLPQGERDSASIYRSVRLIKQIALSNDWDYFVTFTLSPDKVNDRTDYKSAIKRMTQCFRDINKVSPTKIEYLLIPEKHHDGINYHFHGLIYGLDSSFLTVNKYGYLDFPLFARKFGYVSLSPVKDTRAASLYILKYISKSISTHSELINNGFHTYYVSRGVKRPTEVLKMDSVSIDYSLLNIVCDTIDPGLYYDNDISPYKFNTYYSLLKEITNA